MWSIERIIIEAFRNSEKQVKYIRSLIGSPIEDRQREDILEIMEG